MHSIKLCSQETHRFAVLNVVDTLLDIAKTDPVPEYLQCIIAQRTLSQNMPTSFTSALLHIVPNLHLSFCYANLFAPDFIFSMFEQSNRVCMRVFRVIIGRWSFGVLGTGPTTHTLSFDQKLVDTQAGGTRFCHTQQLECNLRNPRFLSQAKPSAKTCRYR